MGLRILTFLLSLSLLRLELIQEAGGASSVGNA